MTINEAIASVLDGVNRSTDDFPVRKRFVYKELLFARNELIKQELNKNRLMNESSAQTIECVTFTRVDASSCYDCESGIFVLRSDIEIPDFIESDYGPAIVNVYLANGVAVSPLSFEDWENRKHRRNKLPGMFGYAMRNGRIFILDYDDVDELIGSIAGHFSNPEDVIRLNKETSGCSKDLACRSILDYEFDCPGHIVRRVIEITRSVVFRKLGIPADDSNNSKFDTNVKSNQSASD